MTEDRDKWRKYVHGVANPRIKDGRLKNRTDVKFEAILVILSFLVIMIKFIC